MADSKLEQICQYCVAQVDADGKPEGLLVERQRTLPLDPSNLPAAILYLRHEAVVKIVGRSTVTRREVLLRWELRVEGEPSDQKLDPLRVWLVQQMMADFSLGGLAKEIEEVSGQWDQKAEDLIVGACAHDFKVTYYTKVNDLTT
jgi:hypothetical protein